MRAREEKGTAGSRQQEPPTEETEQEKSPCTLDREMQERVEKEGRDGLTEARSRDEEETSKRQGNEVCPYVRIATRWMDSGKRSREVAYWATALPAETRGPNEVLHEGMGVVMRQSLLKNRPEVARAIGVSDQEAVQNAALMLAVEKAMRRRDEVENSAEARMARAVMREQPTKEDVREVGKLLGILDTAFLPACGMAEARRIVCEGLKGQVEYILRPATHALAAISAIAGTQLVGKVGEERPGPPVLTMASGPLAKEGMDTVSKVRGLFEEANDRVQAALVREASYKTAVRTSGAGVCRGTEIKRYI